VSDELVPVARTLERFDPTRFRSAVHEVAVGLRAVEETITWDGDIGVTAQAMIELAPRLGEMARQLELLAEARR
jgi:hypothetical protein